LSLNVLLNKQVNKFPPFWVGAILALGLILPLCVRAEPIANRTANWGMENWGGSYGTYNHNNTDWDLQVATNWHRFTQSGQEPRFMKDTVYADLFSGLGAIPRPIEGSYSQNLWLGHPFTAGIYQQINGVTPNTPYAAKSWMFSVYRTSATKTHDKIMKQVGIDPYGGVDPSSPNIVWGEANGHNCDFLPGKLFLGPGSLH